MAGARHHTLLNYLRRMLGAAADGGVSDADLLRRFVQERDEAAFELLMWRHAAMVLHVCRQVLGEVEAAEDAFQATFLVFVRKAGSISRREVLGSWLYRVAYRTALKARTQSKKRPCSVPELDCLAAPADADDAGQRELRRMICEEVDRLPAKYRAPIVACFFEGKTHEEAAKQLGWPRGTVAGRLARAREMLRQRLTRRGVALPAAALMTALSVRTSQAALAGLIETTIPITKQFAAGQAAIVLTSPRVAALTEGVLQAMNGIRMKIMVAALLIAGFGGASATLWAQRREREQPPPANPAPRIAEAPAEDNGKAGSRAYAPQPEDAAKELARNKARSRENLKQLALAMHNYHDTYGGQFPPPAITDKKGKALLSWRVALLPYLEGQYLYSQFRLDEPWDSAHNKKLLSKMPAVFAPPGVKTRQPFSTFYQVFVSARSRAGGGQPAAGVPGGPGGMPVAPPGTPATPRGRSRPGGAPGGPPGGMPGGPGMPGAMGGAAGEAGDSGPHAAFVKGKAARIADFNDGTSNTLLIIEAGNPVPWTKPEDLRYAEDEPLPELGGLFPDAIHAAFADGAVHTLMHEYDEQHLRYAITRDDGNQLDWVKIQGRPYPDAKERGQGGEASRIEKLEQDQGRLQAELKKLRAEMDALKAEVRRMQRPGQRRDP